MDDKLLLRLARGVKVFLEEVEQGGQVDFMASGVDVEDEIFRLVEVDIYRTDFFDGLAGEGDVELGFGFFKAILALEGAGRDEGINIGEIDEIAKAGELPAHAVLLFHVIHVG